MKPLGFLLQEMRELLGSRDAIIISAPGSAGYVVAYAHFSEFVEDATKRIEDCVKRLILPNHPRRSSATKQPIRVR